MFDVAPPTGRDDITGPERESTPSVWYNAIMRVIVVGAGVSGLATARELGGAGHEVVVLEGRSRIGGRTWTVDLGDAPADLGGSWIHGPFGNPLADVVAEAGLSWHNDGVWGGATRIVVDGEGPLDGPDTATVVAAVLDFHAEEALAALDGDPSYGEGVAWFLDDRDFGDRQRMLVEYSLRCGDAGLNTAGPADRIALAGNASYVDLPGGNVALSGGYRTLVDFLATGLDIRVGQVVTEIAHGQDGVMVTASNEVHHADQVVVTLPLGVLQSGTVTFDPPIPNIEQRIGRLAMGNLEKVVLRFSDRWWPDNVRRMSLVSEHRRFTDWVDITAHSGAPTLVAFHNPTIAGYGDDRIAQALEVLRAMFPDAPDPIAARATDWSNDPFAHGSYSYVPVGGSPDDMRALGGRQTPQVVLAGEHTVPEFFGTVHGAYLSGRRAADAIIGEHST